MSVAYASSLPSVAPPAAVRPSLPGTDATWGGLLREARRDLQEALRLLQAGMLPGRGATVDAMQAYADVILAAAATWHALRVDGQVRPVGAAELDAHLRCRRCTEHVRSVESTTAAASALRTAAVVTRAAADLVATHRGPGGRWRAPESSVLADAVVVNGGLGAIADLVMDAVRVAAALTAQTRSNRIGAAQAARTLGDPYALLAAARRCRGDTPELMRSLDDLRVARPTLRHEQPILQLSDRLRRVRAHCWELSQTGAVSVATLADIAACATALNAVAAASRWPTCSRLAWRSVRRSLSELRTVEPRTLSVRADVARVRQLLATGVVREEARPVIEAAVAGLPELAAWSAAALTRVGVDRVYVLGAALRGHEVSDYPELVVAKLTGRIVPAPSRRLAVIAATYAEAAATPLLSWSRAASS